MVFLNFSFKMDNITMFGFGLKLDQSSASRSKFNVFGSITLLNRGCSSMDFAKYLPVPPTVCY